MTLTEWNERTYQEVKTCLDRDGKAAVVNATGVGKSSVLIKCMLDHPAPERILLLAPRGSILDQFEGYEQYPENVERMTYQSLMAVNKRDEMERLKGYSLIISDEMHRVGASEWGKGFAELMKVNEEAKRLGASATPYRYDTGEDIVKTWYDGNSCGNITLEQALDEGILPVPIYIACDYYVKVTIRNSLQMLQRSTLPQEEIKSLSDVLRHYEMDWESSEGVRDIMRRHFLPRFQEDRCLKAVVFCSDTKQMQVLQKEFDGYMKEMFERKGATYTSLQWTVTTSRIAENREKFLHFLHGGGPGEVMICWSIDMFDEGLHVDDLDTIIMFKQTYSQRVFEQELGRILTQKYGALLSDGSFHPLVLDMVGNCNTIGYSDMIGRVLSKLEENDGGVRDSHEKNGEAITYFMDYNADFRQLLQGIRVRLDSAWSPQRYDFRNLEGVTRQEICKHYGMSYSTLMVDMESNGLSLEEAAARQLYELGGEVHGLAYYCQKHGKSMSFVQHELGRGRDLLEVLTSEPKRSTSYRLPDGFYGTLPACCKHANRDVNKVRNAIRKIDGEVDLQAVFDTLPPDLVQYDDIQVPLKVLCKELNLPQRKVEAYMVEHQDEYFDSVVQKFKR